MLRPQREGRAPSRPFGEATLLSLPAVGTAFHRRPHLPAPPKAEGTTSDHRPRISRDRMVGTAFHHRPLPSEELGKPERPPVRTQQRIVCLMQNFAKVKLRSTIRELRYVGKSHVACLLIMFLKGRLAMPCIRHENVRHATLLFCAEGVGPW